MADKIKITCVVNNCVSTGSKLRGEHGLAFLVQAGHEQILFDTGQSGDILEYNLRALGETTTRVKHIVLSHGHSDHCGGLDWALAHTRDVQVTADSAIFAKKLKRVGSEFEAISISLTQEQVKEKAALNLINDQPYQVTRGVSVSGRILRVTPFEVLAGGKYFIGNDMMIEEDPFMDERALVIEAEKGLVVLTGCCHAGLINTLTTISKSSQRPLLAVIGGTHLEGATMDRINKTILPLREKFKPQGIYLNHCTGMEAFIAMRQSLGAAVKECPAGTVIEY